VLPPLRWLAVDLLAVGHIGSKDGEAGSHAFGAGDGIESLHPMQRLPGTGSLVCDGLVLRPMAHHLRSDTALQLAGTLVFRDML